MFTKKKSWGDHTIYQYDTNHHPFLEYFRSLYGTYQLDQLHQHSSDYNKYKDRLSLGALNDTETDLHKRFYDSLRQDSFFKILYCTFIQHIHKQFFPNEKWLIYQSYPSIRIQFMESVVIPPHADSDHIGNHPLGEKNFIIPITKMFDTNTVFIESSPGRGDFQGVELEYGDLFAFNGNTCVHYNEKNQTGKLRISLDFRVMLVKDYMTYLTTNETATTNPRDPTKKRKPVDMMIGGYYQVCRLNDSIETMTDWFILKEPIVQSKPLFGEAETKAVMEYMQSGGYITEYTKTQEFEQQLASYIRTNHCIMTPSGTTALTLALLTLGVGKEDEVIVPNYTMIATANTVVGVGATLVLADVAPDSYTLSLSEVQRLYTDKTKAVIHVSLNNRCKDLYAISEFCKQKGIYLIEDAAQSLGCWGSHQYLGTYGDVGCFSLSTPKIISTGQGGFMITNNDSIAEKARCIKNFGRTGKDEYDSTVIGLNFKYTDLQAVIGMEQLKDLNRRCKEMKRICNQYAHFQYNDMCENEACGWFPWFVDRLIEERDQLQRFLQLHKIETRKAFPLISDIHKLDMINTPNAKKVSTQGLFLPTHLHLTSETIKHICKLISLFLDYV